MHFTQNLAQAPSTNHEPTGPELAGRIAHWVNIIRINKCSVWTVPWDPGGFSNILMKLNWIDQNALLRKGGEAGGGRGRWELWAFLKCDLTSEAVPGASRDEGIAPVSVERTGEQ